MKKFNFLVFIYISFFINTSAQKKDTINLKEVLITSTRIDVPFSKNSKNITIISSEEITQSTATNLTDLLQNIEGISIIKRGLQDTQSDINIRGGNFQQVLLLIDGFKTEDPQTGHHTMNMMIPLENIERIEIIKGASARVFGQNAFTGAINIVTKKTNKDKLRISFDQGSFEYIRGGITASKKLKKSNHQIHYSHQENKGYRFNSDFKNNNYFIKSSFDTKKEPIELLATFAERKFGAQYFYTSPASNFNEYEETQASLVGISTKYTISSLVLKPKIYWKRNQDMFLLKRETPSFSRNHNISNKVGIAINTAYKSNLGTSGFGIDIAKTSLISNNLGDQQRNMFSLFVEHRYVNKKKTLDITPGIALSYYSDFDLQTFPGLDIGYKLNDKFRLIYNIGTSYRVPTYTEMYINIPNFLTGNSNLKSETAFTQEIGARFRIGAFNLQTSLFNRVSENLIDYVKETSTSSVFKATNLRKITTKGIEFHSDVAFTINKYKQFIKFGYTFLEDDYEDVSVYQSRYILNTSMKYHFTSSIQTQFINNLFQTITYKYVEKPLNTYRVLDVKVSANIKKFTIFFVANNLLDTEYLEKNHIPMPKSNYQVGVILNLK